MSKENDIENKSIDKHEKEHFRLSGRSPLITIIVLSFAPVLSQFTSALNGAIDTMWISKSVGEVGMTAVAAYTAFDNIGRAFGFFCSVAGSSQVSALFGSGNTEEASQVIVDLLRVCLLSGIFVPAILIPLIKPGVRWFGASEEVVNIGFNYLFPILIFTFSTCIFVSSGGFLQGEGRSFLYGMIQIASLLFNMFVFDPIFLLIFKWGLPGAAYARILSETLPAIILIFLYFKGKFAIKPKFSQFFNKFSSKTWIALKVGVSQLVSNLSISIPGIVVRKLIGNSTNSPQSFNDALAGFNIVFRYAQISTNFNTGITMGTLPPSSYAFAAKNFERWFSLQWHMNWICLTWSSFTCFCSWVFPYQIASFFSKGDGYLFYATQMVRNFNVAGFLVFTRLTFATTLQSIQRGGRSALLSFISQFISILGFAFLLYYTNKFNPIRLVYCYSLSYVL